MNAELLKESSLRDRATEVVDSELAKIQAVFSEELHPRVSEVMRDFAVVTVREALGEDVALAKAALASSIPNLTVVQENLMKQAARNVAFSVLSAVVRIAMGRV